MLSAEHRAGLRYEEAMIREKLSRQPWWGFARLAARDSFCCGRATGRILPISS